MTAVNSSRDSSINKTCLAGNRVKKVIDKNIKIKTHPSVKLPFCASVKIKNKKQEKSSNSSKAKIVNDKSLHIVAHLHLG